MKIHRKRGRRRRETHTQESAARQTQTAALQPCDVWSPAHPLSSRGPQFTFIYIVPIHNKSCLKMLQYLRKNLKNQLVWKHLVTVGRETTLNRKKFPAGSGLAFKRWNFKHKIWLNILLSFLAVDINTFMVRQIKLNCMQIGWNMTLYVCMWSLVRINLLF